jgi:predicted GNAT family acetyltransferase
MPDTAPDVIHNSHEQRFEATIDGHLNVADYVLSNGTLVMTHTAVHPSLQGRGIAAALVERALAFARAEGLKVDPVCSYVQGYLQRHPESRGLVA